MPPGTETFDRLRKFMGLTPDQRDEALWLQEQRFKSLLDSEGIVNDVKEFNQIMNGHREEPGMIVRVKWMEDRVKKLVASNAKLQAALYVCTGVWIATKFYFDYLHKP